MRCWSRLDRLMQGWFCIVLWRCGGLVQGVGRLYCIKSKMQNRQSIIITLSDGLKMAYVWFTRGEWKLFSLQGIAMVVYLRWIGRWLCPLWRSVTCSAVAEIVELTLCACPWSVSFFMESGGVYVWLICLDMWLSFFSFNRRAYFYPITSKASGHFWW